MIQPQSATLATLLVLARDLTAQDHFDAAVVLRLLASIQLSTLDEQAHGAVTHARLAAQSAQSIESTSRDAMARLALSRVATVLEAQLKAEYRDSSCQPSATTSDAAEY